MALVGDVICSARESIPDPCMTAMPPSLGTPTAAAGGALPSNIWYLVATVLTPWGESAPSNEVSVTLAAGQGTIFVPWGTDVNIGLTGLRIYFGRSSGAENQYIEFPGDLASLVSVMTISTGGVVGVPPQRSSAYLPDTDGRLINASTMFRWLNEALNLLSVKSGGIQDATGVSTVGGQPHYRLVHKWIKVNRIWFDGWELLRGQRNDIFYRNATTAIPAISVTVLQADRSVIELFPQPNRSAGTGTTTALIGPYDTSFTVNSTAGWVLPFGLARISSQFLPGGSEEIIGYANLGGGTTFNGVVRGLGGTYPAGLYEKLGPNNAYPNGWPIGSLVEELNVRISGYRMAEVYSPGKSYVTLNVPDGWADILPLYLDSKALDFQGAKSDAMQKRKEFLSYCDDFARQNKPPLQGPIQVGGAGWVDSLPRVGLGGSWWIT